MLRLYTTDIRTLDPTELKQAHFAAGDTCDLMLGGRANASTVANISSFGEGTFQRALSGLEQQV